MCLSPRYGGELQDMKADWLIVGAGYTGAVLAERIASQLGRRVLLVDRRGHIAGNAYDYYDEYGVLVHKYGPHLFHTNSKKVWNYLSQFTEWRLYSHRVLAAVDGKKVPVPFNLNSLQSLFPASEADRLQHLLLDQYGYGVKVPILKMRETAKGDLRFLADFIYQKIFYGYSTKQWGLRPDDLDASVTARVPVYISHDDRYFQDAYQAMPSQGYTAMFCRMLAHPNIELLLNADYPQVVETLKFNRMIYTGPMDSFFGYIHGELPYRSLGFEMVHHDSEFFQEVTQVNYPNENAFTRITEFKHATGQKISGTTVAVEYPQPYRRGENEPYYPIPREEYRDQYERYVGESKSLRASVLFGGRLADYRYYNMDEAVGRALNVFECEVAGHG